MKVLLVTCWWLLLWCLLDTVLELAECTHRSFQSCHWLKKYLKLYDQKCMMDQKFPFNDLLQIQVDLFLGQKPWLLSCCLLVQYSYFLQVTWHGASTSFYATALLVGLVDHLCICNNFEVY